MNKYTISTFIILGLGTLTLVVRSWIISDDIRIDLAEEDIHLYL